ncbi:MAG: molecular chaperone TorD family protein [Eggerthellaceae bacterium]|nr:molecular chaperone TorD family protein [Eggerthellaceae bacterium]
MREEYRIFFNLVGTVLCQFPSRELFGTLVEEGVFEELPLTVDDEGFRQGAALLADWNRSLGGRLDEDSYHKLVADNTFLFAGLQEMSVPPWESFYFNKERMIFQKETMEVRNWYRKHGFQSSKLNHEPDDHIGLELLFIARLLETCDEDPAALDDARAFAVGHPVKWAHLWAARVLEHAQTDLYRGLARVIPPSLRAFAGE